MSSETCTHGYPSPKSCLDCIEDEGIGAEPKPELTVEVIITARFDGRSNCAGCNLPIREGQRIAKMSNDSYRHVGCAS